MQLRQRRPSARVAIRLASKGSRPVLGVRAGRESRIIPWPAPAQVRFRAGARVVFAPGMPGRGVPYVSAGSPLPCLPTAQMREGVPPSCHSSRKAARAWLISVENELQGSRRLRGLGVVAVRGQGEEGHLVQRAEHRPDLPHRQPVDHGGAGSGRGLVRPVGVEARHRLEPVAAPGDAVLAQLLAAGPADSAHPGLVQVEGPGGSSHPARWPTTPVQPISNRSGKANRSPRRQ
jgi:hypothetical protein